MQTHSHTHTREDGTLAFIAGQENPIRPCVSAAHRSKIIIKGNWCSLLNTPGFDSATNKLWHVDAPEASGRSWDSEENSSVVLPWWFPFWKKLHGSFKNVYVSLSHVKSNYFLNEMHLKKKNNSSPEKCLQPAAKNTVLASCWTWHFVGHSSCFGGWQLGDNETVRGQTNTWLWSWLLILEVYWWGIWILCYKIINADIAF